MLQSRQFDLFRKLGAKLLIEDESAQGAPPVVLRGITPVIDVSRLLISEEAQAASKDISGGGGGFVTYHTVPVGVRWHMRWFFREVTTISTQLNILKSVANILLEFTTLSSAAQRGSFEGIILEENDSIGLIETGDAGDTAIFLNIMFGLELLS